MIYKSPKRKELELQAMLAGVTITFASRKPLTPKVGDRWKNTKYAIYSVYRAYGGTYGKWIKENQVQQEYWVRVTSKEFFDLSTLGE